MTNEEENQLEAFRHFVNGVFSFHDNHEKYKNDNSEKGELLHSAVMQLVSSKYADQESISGGDVAVINKKGVAYLEKLRQKKEKETIEIRLEKKKEQVENNWWSKDNYSNLKWLIGILVVIAIAVATLVLKKE